MTDLQSPWLFQIDTIYIQHMRPSEAIPEKILSFPINALVMHITPGRSLRKSLGMGLQFMSLAVMSKSV